MIESVINNVLSKKYDRTPNPAPSASTLKTIYFSLPYFGHKSVMFKSNFMKLVTEYYPNIDIKLVFVNDNSIGKIFPFKDSIPKGLRSRVVYNFRCAHSSCASAYVGSTVRSLNARVAEHRGISVRTGVPFLSPPHSSIRSHSDTLDHPLSLDQFKILGSSQNHMYLRILESLHILKKKPDLNDMQSAHPLSIVYK